MNYIDRFYSTSYSVTSAEVDKVASCLYKDVYRNLILLSSTGFLKLFDSQNTLFYYYYSRTKFRPKIKVFSKQKVFTANQSYIFQFSSQNQGVL